MSRTSSVALFCGLAISQAYGSTLATITVTCLTYQLPEDPSKTVTDPHHASYGTPCAPYNNGVGLPNVSGAAAASADYGSLSASAGSNGFTGGVERSLATADFSDTLTITGGSGPAYVVYRFSLIYSAFEDLGSASSSFVFTQNSQQLLSSHAVAGLLTTMADGQMYPYYLAPTLSENTLPTSFQFGQPFSIEGLLQSATGSFNASANAQISLADIAVYDANLMPLSGLQIQSASGAAYPFSSAVPEPASILLMIAGAALLIPLRRMIQQ